MNIPCTYNEEMPICFCEKIYSLFKINKYGKLHSSLMLSNNVSAATARFF